jgi:hypothetical protein
MNQPADGLMDILRQTNATIALTCILRAIFTKSRFTNFSFDVVNLLTRLQNADERFGKLETGIELCLSRNHDPESSPDAVKERCKATIRLLIVLVAGNDNVNQNNLNG